MLKSTGYFRAIECPFGECCRRPYCHFRHRGRGLWGSSPGEARTGAEYDPYSPDLPKVPPCFDDGVLEIVPESSLDILELERVNKAIEAVKSEVEREQRKYEKLLGTQKDYSVPKSKSKHSASFTSLEYDPGNYTSSGTYNPTPLARVSKGNKYTLDDLDRTAVKTSCLEYVPTAVIPAAKNKTNKYVIDNCKPHTDMEYDPMSNYSARLLSKDKPQQGTKRNRPSSQDEGYTPSPKKLCNNVSVDARFSDSEDENEYVVQQSAGKYVPSKKTEKVSVSTKASKHINVGKKVKEIAVQYDMEDIGKPVKNHSKESSKHNSDKSKSENKTTSKEQPKNRESGSSSLAKETKKEKSKAIVKNKCENVKNGDNIQSHKNKSSRPDKKIEKLNSVKDPIKGSSSKNKKEQLQNKCKKDKMQSKKESNDKTEKVKNGHIKEKSISERSLKSKSTAPSGVKVKSKQRSLSHVDLFGDESSEEEAKVKKRVPHRGSLGSDGGGHSDTEGESSTKVGKLVCRRVSSSSVDSIEIDYSALEKELDSDSDPMEECLRVFNESQDVKTENKGRMWKQPHEDGEEKSEHAMTTLIPGQKKRISHVNCPANSSSSNKPVIHPSRLPTPQEICYQRIQRAQEQAIQLLAQQKELLLSNAAQTSSPTQHSQKKRIAHFPGIRSPSFPIVSTVTEAKTRKSSSTDETSNGSVHGLKNRTLTGMASKTTTTTAQKRQAHVPSLQSASLKRPVIPTEFGAKVPTTVRQRYLNLFIDECLKFCRTEQEAFDKALEEEKIVYNRSSSRNIYLNVAVNTLKKLRTQGQGSKATPIKNTNKRVISHESMLGGKAAAKLSFSVQRNTGHQQEELTGAVLYTKLKDYIMSPEQLQEHGYPMAHPDKPGKAMLFTTEEKKISASFSRICCRCGAEYFVTPSGNCVRREECVHHWGRLRRQRVPGGWETHYNCCSGAVGSTGCQVAKQHVQDNRKDSLDGFVKTFEKLPAADGNAGVFALDCEMCYTTHGLELTRVTVINSERKVVYDTFVLPDNRIVDYNTRFSGVTEDDMQNTTITLRDVQAVLLSMFSSDTILIGHSLESDFFALKLIHPTVVDTAIVFPHRLGLPYKRALRSLMADHLKRIIQDSVEGHDSSEDACSCMELMIWKIKEDAKVKR
ncbi:RNA exonuclease 1 homolog isoform X1 [Pelobates fuscus]|uniref:RNA exonuclease 1 homolog isoform X1 n=1 Tax=Pelobates fuscus TaxID=191477 RepID=UPI002FE43207